mgnify:FL=1
MCGFIGAISNSIIDDSKFQDADKFLECRGPDDHKWMEKKLNKKKNLLFSFHRLSIIDLSENASQPMSSNKYKSEIMFNGEIYNYPSLRKEIEKSGEQFTTSHSDTETLLLGFSLKGKSFVNELEGQFSIAFVNSKNNTLTLFRDRLGQKPMYYSINKDGIVFSSNFKSILSYKKDLNLDIEQMTNFIELGIVPSPNTLDKDIFKLCPGELIEISLDDFTILEQYRYWQLEDFIDNKNFDEKEFFKLFHSAVKKRLISDVPVASLLSGGIDSTSILKSLTEINNEPVNTYSINNTDQKYDESYWSFLASNTFNSNHMFEIIDGNNLQINPVEVIKSFDEPYADPSIFPSNLVYRTISNNYKVAISGDGGDELIGGYEKIHQSINKGFISSKLIFILKKLIPSFFGTANNLEKFSNSPIGQYKSLTIDNRLLNVLSLNSQNTFENFLIKEDIPILKKLLIADYKFYLSELMMHKVDRTSMANSVEIRSPFLDHKLVEYVISSNLSFFEKSNPKKILKNYLKEDFDDEFLERKKMGFVFDLESWIFGNKDMILSEIDTINYLQIQKVKKLFKYKSRINSIRILKLFTLSVLINEYKSITD